MQDGEKDGLDLIGIGKLASSIPQEVYTQSASAIIDSFNKLIAPITETTSGFGRYIRQKFNNMVQAEKALAVYSVKNAITKAELKASNKDGKIIPPIHPKSFVKSVEEASKETDPILHEMWENLLADQLVNENFHPHFVETLPHFSPSEARLLISLLPWKKIGENAGRYLAYSDDSFRHWVKQSGDKNLAAWNYSCILLCEFRFADIIAPKGDMYRKEDKVTIMYRTVAGDTFLSAVS
jgi:hypothetical protein